MQTPCLWVRGEFIPLRSVPVDRKTAERELSYEGPLPGPLPEPLQVVEKGTHWVDTALNAHKGTNQGECRLHFQRLPARQRQSLPRTPSSMGSHVRPAPSTGGPWRPSPSSHGQPILGPSPSSRGRMPPVPSPSSGGQPIPGPSPSNHGQPTPGLSPSNRGWPPIR